MQPHKITPAGESTERWAIRTEPGFIGSIKQLTCCARCGEILRKGPNDPICFRDIFKPTVHVLCDECNAALPE